ncbi:hypothetical protein A3H75_01730 [Candidatus Uhrbacteria bacterium RIFCSPLOWO2_02_FULL_51_9]|uniref:Uncharacterized protein n=1 Tax=Candidatus Uhrbacteria bacterium RIFCSPLOWO2_02_FULL_51_9 TaxID=1802410 RepID=A0A1F7VCB0_9BACT|nr:MAG: hypothetical protein A3H75_01730 [Candidatus Uhrbacteria bacterium RIFCSPLOWO2_02_FULL_51_9]
MTLFIIPMSMDEPRDQETLEENDVENEDEKREPDAPEPVLNRQDGNPHKEGGGFVRGLIWLIVLALIAWGGYTAYKNRNAEPESSSQTATTTATTATGTPEQPAQ